MSGSFARPPRDRGSHASRTVAVAEGDRRRRPVWLIPLLVLLALLLIGLLLYFLLRGGSDGKNTTAPAAPTTAISTTPVTPATTAPATTAPAGAAAGPASASAPSAGSAPAGAPGAGGPAGAALVGGGGVAAAPATGALASAGPSNGASAGTPGAQVQGTVLFPADSAALDGAAQQVITSAGQRITAAHPAKVTVTAYTTDAPGAAPSTSAVSQQRGNAVAAALKAQLGAATIPVEVVSKGAADPIATNDTADGRQLNRRVTVTTS